MIRSRLFAVFGSLLLVLLVMTTLAVLYLPALADGRNVQHVRSGEPQVRLVLPLAADPSMLVVGDSISAGWDASALGDDYVSRLSSALHAKSLTVRAVPGINTPFMYDSLLRTPLHGAVDLIVVEIGTNDTGISGDYTTFQHEYPLLLSLLLNASP